MIVPVRFPDYGVGMRLMFGDVCFHQVIESPSDHCLAAVRLFVKSGEEIVSLNDMLLAQPSLFG